MPRAWWGIELPGFREAAGTYERYGGLPALPRALDDDLQWLLAEPPIRGSLGDEDEELPARLATGVELEALTAEVDAVLPSSFVTFIIDPAPRTRVRSCTACYLDLGESIVCVPEGGHLIHFLSDQQWVLHWLLYADAAGREAVVVTPAPYAFDDPDGPWGHLDLRTFDPDHGSAAVCAESFTEFLCRFRLENEIWRALALEDTPPASLPEEARRYLEQFTG